MPVWATASDKNLLLIGGPSFSKLIHKVEQRSCEIFRGFARLVILFGNIIRPQMMRLKRYRDFHATAVIDNDLPQRFWIVQGSC